MATHRTIDFNTGSSDSAYTTAGTNTPTVVSGGLASSTHALSTGTLAAGNTSYLSISGTRPFSLAAPTWVRFYINTSGVTAGPTNFSDILRFQSGGTLSLRLSMNSSADHSLSLSVPGAISNFTSLNANLNDGQEHYCELGITASDSGAGSLVFRLDGVETYASATNLTFGDNWFTNGPWLWGMVSNLGVEGEILFDEFIITEGEASPPGPATVPNPGFSGTVSGDLGEIARLLTGNTHVTVFGDSISVASEQRRNFWGMLRGNEFRNLVGLTTGVALSGDSGVTTEILTTNGASAAVGALYSAGAEAETDLGGGEAMGLPLNHMREWVSTVGGTLNGDRLYRTTLAPTAFDGETPPFFDDSKRIKARQLFRAVSQGRAASQASHLRTAQDDTANEQTHAVLVDGCRPKRINGFDPETATTGRPCDHGEINALFPDLLMDGADNNVSGQFELNLMDSTPSLIDQSKYVSHAGVTWYLVDENGDPEPGVKLRCLADSSYDLDSLYLNELPTTFTGSASKRYTIDQLAHWLDATTVDGDEEQLVIFYFAYEGSVTEEQHAAAYANCRAAFARAGLKAPKILSIFSQNIFTQTNLGNNNNTRDAARSTWRPAADADSAVYPLDFLGLVNDVTFNASETYSAGTNGRDLNAENLAFLTANSGAPFTYGNKDGFNTIDFTTDPAYQDSTNANAGDLADPSHWRTPDASAWANRLMLDHVFSYDTSGTSGGSGGGGPGLAPGGGPGLGV